MTEPRPPDDDPLALRDELREALAAPELDTVGPDGTADTAGRGAAYRLAVALGSCRLFGVEPGDDLDGTLPVPLALAAAAGLEERLAAGTAATRDLGPRWDATPDPVEADDLCAGLLEARMDAWAAWVAVGEACDSALDDGDAGADELAAARDRLADALGQLDDALEDNADLLSVVTGTRLLDNWRQLLAAAYREPLPWWLDGTLEEAAARAEAEALATQPGPQLWRALRRGRFHAAHPVTALPPLRLAALAARSAADAGEAPGRELRWRSPDGAWLAGLWLPEASDAGEEARPRPLCFTGAADDAPAVALKGQRVRLGPAVGTIDAAGKFFVTLTDLRAAEELALAVGEPPEVWLAEPSSE